MRPNATGLARLVGPAASDYRPGSRRGGRAFFAARCCMDSGFQVEPEARNLGEGLYDLPGGTGIWHGYIVAQSQEEAERLVAESY